MNLESSRVLSEITTYFKYKAVVASKRRSHGEGLKFSTSWQVYRGCKCSKVFKGFPGRCPLVGFVFIWALEMLSESAHGGTFFPLIALIKDNESYT